MIKCKTIIFLVGLFLTVPSQIIAEKMTDNWKLTGYTKYRDAVFADMSRLSSPAPGITAIWIKIAPSTRSKYLQFINQYLTTVNKNGRGFKSIEILCEIDCSSHLIRFTKFSYLDENRKIIHGVHEARPGWMQIIQGGIWHPVEKVACPDKKQPAK